MASALVGTDVYFFGGIGVDESFRSLHILHCEQRNSLRWSCPPSEGDPPLYGAGSSMCYHQGRLILFGGTDRTWSGVADCYFYNVKDRRWFNAEDEFNFATSRTGTFGHSAVMSSKGMLVVGGTDTDVGTVYLLSSVRDDSQAISV